MVKINNDPTETAPAKQETETVKSERTRPTRKKVYERVLEMEIPQYVRDIFQKDNYYLSYIRWSLEGEEDYRYLSARENEGFEFVKVDELPPDFLKTLRVYDSRARKGMVIAGDCVLMKIDNDLLQSRKDYYEEMTRQQGEAVDINVIAKRKGFKNLGSKTKVAHREPTFQD